MWPEVEKDESGRPIFEGGKVRTSDRCSRVAKIEKKRDSWQSACGFALCPNAGNSCLLTLVSSHSSHIAGPIKS